MRAFKLTVKQSRPECREILVEGELDLASSGQLSETLEGTEPRHRYVLVNLHRCEFIDLSALEILLRAHARLAAEGRELLIFGASGQVRQLFMRTESVEHRFLRDQNRNSFPPQNGSARTRPTSKTPSFHRPRRRLRARR